MVCHTQKNCHDEGAWDGWEETMHSVYVHKYYTCCRLCAQVFNWACLLCSRRACMPLPLAYACWIARGLRLLSLCAPVYVDKYTSILQCMWTSKHVYLFRCCEYLSKHIDTLIKTDQSSQGPWHNVVDIRGTHYFIDVFSYPLHLSKIPVSTKREACISRGIRLEYFIRK